MGWYILYKYIVGLSAGYKNYKNYSNSGLWFKMLQLRHFTIIHFYIILQFIIIVIIPLFHEVIVFLKHISKRNHTWTFTNHITSMKWSIKKILRLIFVYTKNIIVYYRMRYQRKTWNLALNQIVSILSWIISFTSFHIDTRIQQSR